jgi:hypothetical protein
MAFAAMQFSEYQTRVREFLEDTNASSYGWSTDLIKQYINDALQDLVREAALYNVKSAALTVAAVQPTNAYYGLPDDFHAVNRVENDGVALVETTLQEQTTGWFLRSGTPTHYMVGEIGGYNNLRVVPYPAQPEQWVAATAYAVGDEVKNGSYNYVCVTAGTSAGSGGPTGTGTSITDGTVVWDYDSDYESLALTDLVLFYQAHPAPLVNASDVPEIPAGYARALVYYAVSMCYRRNFEDGDPRKAAEFLALYERELVSAKRGQARRFTNEVRDIPWERF